MLFVLKEKTTISCNSHDNMFLQASQQDEDSLKQHSDIYSEDSHYKDMEMTLLSVISMKDQSCSEL